jgi:hypothetical protein
MISKIGDAFISADILMTGIMSGFYYRVKLFNYPRSFPFDTCVFSATIRQTDIEPPQERQGNESV